MNYFAVWYALALVAVLFIGFETRGRTIGEIGSTLTARRSGAGGDQGARGALTNDV